MDRERSKAFEKEFFHLAGVMLDCLYHLNHVDGDKAYFFIGVMDYSTEMWILCQQRAKWQRRNLG